MKHFEKDCLEYAKKWKDSWEHHCIVKDAWLNGFYNFRENMLDQLAGADEDVYVSIKEVQELVLSLNSQPISKEEEMKLTAKDAVKRAVAEVQD